MRSDVAAAAAVPARTVPGSREGPVVTVVIPVRDGGPRFVDVLRALERQTLPNDAFEVVIGDDGSQDDVSIRTAGYDLRIDVTRTAPVNSYAARNRAARLGTGERLAFCDSDCVPAPDWLEEGVAALQRADVVVGDIRWDLPPRVTAWALLDIDLHVKPAVAVDAGRCLGGNLFVRRAFFERVGGFDESLPSGGDDDFGARCRGAGGRLDFAPTSWVAHPTHARARPFLSKIWRVNFSDGVRQGREGARRIALTPWLIPTIGMIRSRRSAGFPLSLDPGRLQAAGARARWSTKLGALAALYLVVPYVARAASSAGRRAGRREALRSSLRQEERVQPESSAAANARQRISPS